MAGKTDCSAIYVASRSQLKTAPARQALTVLRDTCKRLIIVTTTDDNIDEDACAPADEVLYDDMVSVSYLAGIRRGLLAELARAPDQRTPILVTGAHVLGPLGSLKSCFAQLKNDNAALFAGYWHNSEADPQTRGQKLPERIPMLDFAIFSPTLLQLSGFHTLWETLKPAGYFRDQMPGLIALAKFLEKHVLPASYPLAKERLKTARPCLYEAHRLVEEGAPCLPLELFSLDPLVHDQNAIDLRRALNWMRQKEPDFYRAAVDYALSKVPMRDFNAITTQFEVFPTVASLPDKRQWSFGTVAVFIHAYYPEMIDELVGWALNIPAPLHLFVSTATAASRTHIQTRLLDMGFAAEATEVRVVEQNRGRDMSALFITFHDIIQEGQYQVALRLHSKRTPQVSDRVAEGFKAHLFENLAYSRGYVANLLDRMEAEPDIGLVIPPVIHVGFGTLGHSWFNNRTKVQQLTAQMGLEIPLDSATPVAPYGTMYWFRTEALRKMFEWPWQWEEYNPEPQHVDGGLAHAQERLIGYCAQGSGYRVLSVMTPENAALNYSRLEYKMQRLTSYMPISNIIGQDRLLSRGSLGIRARLYQKALEVYGGLITRWPGLRHWLRPVSQVISRALAPNPLRKQTRK